MALRAVPDHPKFHHLQLLLGISRAETLGILELLWHFTGRFRPRGDIGKYANEQIAGWIGWTRDADELIDALVRARWLDENPEHRLLVHDWHQHADESVKKALRRAGHSIITADEGHESLGRVRQNSAKQAKPQDGVETDSGHVRDVSAHLQGMSAKSSPVSRPPEPEPVPGPVPGTPPIIPPTSVETDSGHEFEADVGLKRFLSVYPDSPATRQVPTERAWKALMPRSDVTPAMLIAAAERYRRQVEAMDRNGTQFVISAQRFLDPSMKHWLEEFPLPREPAKEECYAERVVREAKEREAQSMKEQSA